jgi:hypothetical protein
MRWLPALLLLSACSKPPAVASCEDDLSGVWHEQGDAGRGYDWRPSRSGGYEVFAMFDTARPPDGSAKLDSPIVYAPWVWDLDRLPAGISGTRLQRLTRDGASCEVRTPVEIRSCADDTLTIAVKLAQITDFAQCTVATGDWNTLVLVR